MRENPSGPRRTRPEELPALLELVDAVFSGAAPMGPAFPTLFSAANAPWLRTTWDGPVCTAHVGIWRGRIVTRGRWLEVAHVGAVCTRPEHRNRGLATALLIDALHRLQAREVAVVLISGGRGLYRRLGAVPFGALLRYRLDQEMAAALAQRAVMVRPPTGAQELAAIYAGEPVRYERSAPLWRALLPAKGYLPANGGLGALVVPSPRAYLLFGHTRRPRDGGAGPTVLPVDEFAGDRSAVLSALPEALRLAGAEVAELLVQPGDGDMRRQLGAAGLRGDPVGHQGTARVLHQEALARAIGCQVGGSEHAIGTEPEAEEAARLTTAIFGKGGVELPRNDGLQYI